MQAGCLRYGRRWWCGPSGYYVFPQIAETICLSRENQPPRQGASMAELRSFRATYYDTAKVEIANVVTQPWDVITPEMQEKYYRADPHNIVRIIRGREMPQDSETENVFTRAGRFFGEWLRDGILTRDDTDAMYMYGQRFQLADSAFTRRGIITLVRLEDYAAKVILPHERTFPKHNANRLHLMRATKANFGQIFMLYPDPDAVIPQFLSQFDSATPMFTVAVDGVTHSVVRITGADHVRFLTEQMNDKQLFIADGHHRYQTALDYRNEMFPRLSEEGRREVGYRMVTLVSMDDPSVTILPTHRVVKGLPDFQKERFIPRLHELFEVERLGGSTSQLLSFLQRLRELATRTSAFVVCFPDGDFFLARLKDRAAAAAALPGDPHPVVRELDVTILHGLVLEKMLFLTPELQRSGEHIRYYRDPMDAVGMMERNEAQVAFLLNPTRVHQVRDVALAGEAMPQKSTDFFPKLLSGLIMRKLDI